MEYFITPKQILYLLAITTTLSLRLLKSIRLLSDFMPILDISYKWNYNMWPTVSGFFHLT
jgi:hypothetical protein